MAVKFEFVELNDNIKQKGPISKYGNSGNSFDFSVDTDKVLELSRKLSNLEKTLENLFSDVERINIKESWVSAEVDKIANKMEDNKKKRVELCDKLSKLSSAYLDFAEKINNNNDSISNMIRNM